MSPPSRRLTVADLGARLNESADLDWYFNESENHMGLLSNGATDELDAELTFVAYVEAARLHRRIRERLLSIPDSDAGVLQCAYERRPWPKLLVQRLGRLTGVVVRLACALGRWPSDREAQRVIEAARAEWLVPQCAARVGKTLSRLRNEAEGRFSRASATYEATRRRG